MTGPPTEGARPGLADLTPAEPSDASIPGVQIVDRVIHFDPRGILLETLRSDDRILGDTPFAMSYTSVTMPGEFRDRDRWHVHERQTDRFIVVLGEMILALADGRADSPTSGQLNLLSMRGADYDHPATASPTRHVTHLVTIPPGVLHCIGNLSRRPFVLTNFPTRLYDPTDEGRRPFSDIELASVGGTFGWDRIRRTEPGLASQ